MVAVAPLALIVGCGSAPADYEGADNTDPIVEPNACAQLASCCQSIPESSAGICLAGARRGDEAECTISLRELRGDGVCL